MELMKLFTFYSLCCLQVILEVLPISSSGHLSLLYGKKNIPEMIEYIWHIPTAIIISIFIWQHRNILLGTGTFKELALAGVLIILADIVTGLFYYLLKQKRILFPLWLGFIVTASSLFLVSLLPPGAVSKLTYKGALLMGLGQGIALLPGISRLATTVMCGWVYGLTPLLAYVFSLAIQLPLISAAVLKVIYKEGFSPFKHYFSVFGLLSVAVCSYSAYVLLKYVFFLFESQAVSFLGWYMLFPLLYSFYKARTTVLL
jgi:undecaprenyl-diphosphatase